MISVIYCVLYTVGGGGLAEDWQEQQVRASLPEPQI